MHATVFVRIVIVSVEPGAWCAWCGLPTATTVGYVLEALAGRRARRAAGHHLLPGLRGCLSAPRGFTAPHRMEAMMP